MASISEPTSAMTPLTHNAVRTDTGPSMTLGNGAVADTVVLKRVSIDGTNGNLTWGSGSDLAICSFNAATAQTSGSVAELRQLRGSKVWGAVWNDFADFQLLCDNLEFGKCYYDTADGAKICNERCQMSVIGIASNTFGNSVGIRDDQMQVPIAVSGWVLAYVDKEYPCGTPLTNDEFGNLTEMTLEEKRNYPERLVGIYKRKEMDEEFGIEGSKIKVNNRHWVKVK